MSTVSISGEVFARLVGKRDDRDVLLFEVSPALLDAADSNEWSDPCLFRFVRKEGAFVELEFHKIDLSPPIGGVDGPTFDPNPDGGYGQ